MRIVRRSASRLVLRETPLKSWLMAAFCFSVGILGILMVALDSSWVGGWLFAGVGVLGGVVVMLGAGAVVTLDFDRYGGTLTVKRWLFGPRVTTYPIRDLVSVEVESTTDDDCVACYRISLNTASKETITPVSDYSYGRDKHQAAGVIREFLGLRAPDDWAMLQALVKNPPGDLVGLSIEAIAEQAASLRAAISTFDASGDSEFERTERAERIRSAVSTLGADLGLSLARLGWSIQSPPGEPIVMGGGSRPPHPGSADARGGRGGRGDGARIAGGCDRRVIEDSGPGSGSSSSAMSRLAEASLGRRKTPPALALRDG